MKSCQALSSRLLVANDIHWRGCGSRSNFHPGASNGQRAVLLYQAELLGEACRTTTTCTPAVSCGQQCLLTVHIVFRKDDDPGTLGTLSGLNLDKVKLGLRGSMYGALDAAVMIQSRQTYCRNKSNQLACECPIVPFLTSRCASLDTNHVRLMNDDLTQLL